VLKQDGKPAIVKEQEIINLKVYLSGQDVNISDAFEFYQDQEVEVIDGPFKGIVAKAKNEQGKFKLLIEISSLNINFSLVISKNKVVPKKHLEKVVN
jgi:transcription antitermination factor NusG